MPTQCLSLKLRDQSKVKFHQALLPFFVQYICQLPIHRVLTSSRQTLCRCHKTKVFRHLSIQNPIEDHPLLWEQQDIELKLLSYHSMKIFPTFLRRIKCIILLDVQKLFFPVLVNWLS